ncbi:hypothetical protein, partial [Corynebacterium meridianum]
QTALGLKRAQTVATVLETLGVDRTQFTTITGVGSHFPEYKRPDRSANGVLLPAAAAVNRSVRITITPTC